MNLNNKWMWTTIYVLTLLGLVIGHQNVPSIKNSTRVISYAGTTEGSTFFSVYNSSVDGLNWYDAGISCRELDMELAEITTEAKAKVIQSYVNSSQINNTEYWVAGRDAWLPRQFTWNTTGIDVSNTSIKTVVNIGAIGSCITYVPDPDDPVFKLRYCSDGWKMLPNHFLCEMNTPDVK